MQPLQAAAEAAAAMAAIKLQQQQLRLLLEQQQWDEESEDGCSSSAESEGDDPAAEVLCSLRLGPAAAAAAGKGRGAVAAFVAAAAQEAEDEEDNCYAAEQQEGSVDHSEGAAGEGLVFQALNAVVLQLEAHNYGLGLCLTELTGDWAEAWKVGAVAAALAAGSVSGAAPAVPATQLQQQQRQQQQRLHSVLVQQLLGRGLQQQEGCEAKLRHMREVITPFMRYSAAGQTIPDSAGDVAASVLLLQQLQKQLGVILISLITTLKQLKAALSAALSSLQAPGGAGAPVWAGTALGALAVELGRALQASWDHTVSSMKLVGLDSPS
jgi:hypothetical protein